MTALIWAANNGHTKVVQILVNAGANIESRPNNVSAIAIGCLNGADLVVVCRAGLRWIATETHTDRPTA